MKHTTTVSRAQLSVLVAIFMLGASSCSKLASLNTANSIGTTSSVSPNAVSLKVVDQSSSAVVYTDNGGVKNFSLVAGKSYTFNVSSSNLPLGSVVSVVATNTSQPNMAPTSMPLANGSAVFSPSAAGDYSVQVVVNSLNGSNLLSKNYAAAISCQSPTFTANSLNANGISVGGSDNLYTYSAAGVIAGANGQAPYKCAYDLTGVGIVDTAFSDCSQSTTQYASYVQNRNIGVIVKDACNTSYSVSKVINLPAAVPAAPGNIFITGNISAEVGAAATDARVHGMHFSSINTTGHEPVSPSFGGTNFSILSSQNYGMPSSLAYGMKIEVGGIGGTFNLASNMNGSVDTSAAFIAKMTYYTDQAGDSNPAASYTSTTCTTTGIHSVIKNVSGTPCTPSEGTGDKNTATVEIYGDYTCTNASNSAGSSFTISGSFDGYTQLTDSCVGGGGGGGGQPPLQL